VATGAPRAAAAARHHRATTGRRRGAPARGRAPSAGHPSAALRPLDGYETWAWQERSRLAIDLHRLARYARDLQQHRLAEGLAARARTWTGDASGAPLDPEAPGVVTWPAPAQLTLARFVLEARGFCDEVAETFRSLALGAERLDRAEAARDCWRQVVLHRPDDPEARAHLGHTRLESGLWVSEDVARALEHPVAVRQAPVDSLGGRTMHTRLLGERTRHLTLVALADRGTLRFRELVVAGERAWLVLQALGAGGSGLAELDLHCMVLLLRPETRLVLDLWQRRRDEGGTDHLHHRGCWDCLDHDPGVLLVTESDRLDQGVVGDLAHDVVHAVYASPWTWLPAALEEALAALVEEIVAGRTSDACVSGTGSRLLGAVDAPRFRESDRRAACRTLVRVGSARSRPPAWQVHPASLADWHTAISLLQYLLVLDPGFLADRGVRPDAPGLPEAREPFEQRVHERTGLTLEELLGGWEFHVLGTGPPAEDGR
jgi:hypothetical protein